MRDGHLYGAVRGALAVTASLGAGRDARYGGPPPMRRSRTDTGPLKDHEPPPKPADGPYMVSDAAAAGPSGRAGNVTVRRRRRHIRGLWMTHHRVSADGGGELPHRVGSDPV